MNAKKFIMRTIKVAVSLYILYWAIIFLTLVYNSFTEPHEYLASDYRIFKDTPAWDLAKAVRDADTAEIRYQILEKKIPVNYQEQKYGESMLSIATYQNNIKSVKKLLELGANPNLYVDTINRSGYNPVIKACKYKKISVEILKLLMDFGGNPNSVTKGVNKNGNIVHPLRNSAMEEAASSGEIEKIKVLMDYGADINFTPDREYDTDPLWKSLLTEQMNIALFLLEHGAKYDKEYLNPFTNEKENILDLLRIQTFPLDSEKYFYKLKIIEFLKKNGIDYYKTPVPDWIVDKIKNKYPNTWKEYIVKY